MFTLESYRKCEKPFILRITIAVISFLLAVLIIFLMFSYIKRNDNGYAPYEGLKTLHLASILFRHGARTPRGTYNSDPYKNYSWPGGFGALTNEGKQQLYQLGKTMRRRYNGYLPNDYSDDDVYMKSSDKSRTLMSAYLFLAGLYPPTFEQTWNHEIAWQPIPARSLPRELDMVLGAKKNCSEYNEHEKNYTDLPEYKKIVENFKNLYELLSNYTNQTVNTPRSLESLYDIFLIEEHAGLKLPDWAKQFYPDPLKEAAAFSLSTNTFDDFMIRVKGGPLLSEILNNMKKKENGELKPDRKMFIYSAHDITIVNLWRALSFREYFIPDYGSSLVLELHELSNSTDFEVKLFYFNNTIVNEPHRLEMPNCKSPCTLLNFEEATKKYVPVDWEKECKNS